MTNDEAMRAAVTRLIEAVADARGVNKRLLRQAWNYLYPPSPPTPIAPRPITPESLSHD